MKKHRKGMKKHRVFGDKAFFIILGTALFFRLIHLFSMEARDPNFYSPPTGTDMLTYHRAALSFSEGGITSGPLYQHILGILYLVSGDSIFFAKLIQSIMGSFTVLFIFKIADRLFGRRVALVAGFVGTFYQMFLIHETFLLIATYACFSHSLAILMLLRARDAPSVKNLVLAGFVLGAMCLSRASILVFLGPLLLWVFFSFRKRFTASIAIFLPIFCMVLGLSTINSAVSKKDVTLNVGGGWRSLWFRNNRYAYWYVHPPAFYAEYMAKRAKSEGSKVHIEDVLDFAKSNPKRFFLLFLKKFLVFWDRFEIPNNVNYDVIRSWSPILKCCFGFLHIMPFGILGFILTIKRRTLLLHIYLLSFMVATLLTNIMARYRLPFVPVLIVFAGFGMVWLYEKYREGQYKTLSLSLIPLLFSTILLFNQDILGKLYPIFHPEGVVICPEEDALIIRDHGDEWRGERTVALTAKTVIKKELILSVEPTDYGIAALVYDFFCENPPGSVMIEINRHRFKAPLKFSEGLLIYSSIKFPVEWLKRGKNVITIEAKSDTNASIPIDETYCFGRSFKKERGVWKKIEGGELKMHLELYRGKYEKMFR